MDQYIESANISSKSGHLIKVLIGLIILNAIFSGYQFFRIRSLESRIGILENQQKEIFKLISILEIRQKEIPELFGDDISNLASAIDNALMPIYNQLDYVTRLAENANRYAHNHW